MANELLDQNAFEGAGPDPAFGPRSTDESLADGIASSIGVIYFQGKTWSMRWGGERKMFVRADDGTQAAYIDVVILAAANHLSKSFYEKWEPGVQQGRPLCSSLDGIKPDVGVPAKQSETCALCPRNVWRTSEEGRKGKECQDNKRVAVFVLPSSQKMPGGKFLFDEAVVEPVFLRVPPASLGHLAAMGKDMEGRGYDSYTYVTRIDFNPTKSYPEMKFKAIQRLTAKEAPLIQELRSHDLIQRIIVGGRGDAMILPPVTAAAGFAPTPVIEAKAANGQTPPADAGMTGPKGDGRILNASTPTAGPTVADTGPVDETDDALDARIAAMMPSAG